MADPLTMLLSCLYGFFMGSYPVPIKARSVLAANVHPLIFQGYKSTLVCLTGLLFIFPVWARDDAVHLSWWGVASAAAWVPSGFCTIAAVPLIGLSFAIVISCASSSILSFLVFWLVLGEKVLPMISAIITHDLGDLLPMSSAIITHDLGDLLPMISAIYYP